MGANTKTRYGSQNKYLPDQLVEINLALERIMKWDAFSLTITQGSWSGAAASAGTHTGGDGEDLTPNAEKAKEKYLRILGCMYYIRPYLRNVWPRHGHGGRDYSTTGSRTFKAQLVSYHKREDALANRGKDTGYKMYVFPKNIYKGYIGYVQAKKACFAWEQQTKKYRSLRLNRCSKKQITYVVAETEVAGKRWYVTLTGKCILASEWAKIKKPAGATPQKPNVQPKPVPKPVEPPKPKSVALNIGTRNVIFRRLTPTGKNPPFTNVKKGLAYEKRVPLLAKDAILAKLHFLGTSEAGTYAASDLLTAEISKQSGKKWDNILHGDNAGDITQANLWDTTQFKMLSEGKIDLPETDHDWLVWTEQQIIATGQKIWFGVIHSEWRKGGTSAKGNKYDHKREQQSDVAMKALNKKAGKDDIVIILGDFNSSLQNAYDGPGKAAAVNGYVDAEKVAVTQVGTIYNSYHGGENPKNDVQLDRFMIRKAQIDNGTVVVNVLKVDANSATKAGSDHYQVHLEITVNNK